MSRVVLAALCGSGLLVIPGAASAGLVDVGAAGLAPETPMVPIGAVPQGAYGAVPFTISSGPAAGSEIVFGSYFQGQTPTLAGGFVTVPQPSAPGQPVQLLYDGNNYIQVTSDAASPVYPVFAGGPITFRQPISIEITQPISAIGLTAGFLDTPGTLTIDAYTAGGAEIGSVTNTGTGFEAFGLLDPNGAEISGLTIQSSDPAGFEIHDIYLATAVPEPKSWVLLSVGLAGLLMARSRVAVLSRIRRGSRS